MEPPTRGINVWNANIINASPTESVSISSIYMFWWGGDKLEKASMRERLIWIEELGVYSPQILTFYYTAPADLLIPSQTYSNILQFTFLSNDFYMGHVKVYLSNGCYVQYWYDW